MKCIFFFCFLLFASTTWGWMGIVSMGGSPAVNWDLLNEDCNDISDWSDNDTDTAVSEVSPAGQFRLDTNTGAAGDAKARRMRDIGSFPDEFTVKIEIYCDNVGTLAAPDYAEIICSQVDESLDFMLCSDGAFVYDTDSNSTEIGTDLVKEAGNAEWQTWWILVSFGVTGDGTCDVYLSDTTHTKELVGNDVPCSGEWAATDGMTDLRQEGEGTNDMVSHVTSIQIATGLHIP